MTIWISTNGRPSNGAKELSKQLGFRRLRQGKKVKPGDVVVNWGSSLDLGNYMNPGLNCPESVGWAANKLEAFKALSASNVSTVGWTASKDVAQSWLSDGKTIVVRKKLTGHSGDGIVIVEPGEQLPDAPLYTMYVFKEKEFRVHVCNGKVIDTQRKIKDPDREVVTWKVRSHQNGFIFARNNIDPCAIRDELAINAISALALDFGAVDIIQDKKGNYYVLEINTAPGFEGQTVEIYAEAFREYT